MYKSINFGLFENSLMYMNIITSSHGTGEGLFPGLDCFWGLTLLGGGGGHSFLATNTSEPVFHLLCLLCGGEGISVDSELGCC